jgi:hypothetical protein
VITQSINWRGTCSGLDSWQNRFSVILYTLKWISRVKSLGERQLKFEDLRVHVICLCFAESQIYLYLYQLLLNLKITVCRLSSINPLFYLVFSTDYFALVASVPLDSIDRQEAWLTKWIPVGRAVVCSSDHTEIIRIYENVELYSSLDMNKGVCWPLVHLHSTVLFYIFCSLYFSGYLISFSFILFLSLFIFISYSYFSLMRLFFIYSILCYFSFLLSAFLSVILIYSLFILFLLSLAGVILWIWFILQLLVTTQAYWFPAIKW